MHLVALKWWWGDNQNNKLLQIALIGTGTTRVEEYVGDEQHRCIIFDGRVTMSGTRITNLGIPEQAVHAPGEGPVPDVEVLVCGDLCAAVLMEVGVVGVFSALDIDGSD
ncbi:hypothetical protein AG1IA_04922 [Rhizoctonia solani AG-1 IA]|uniref:Uncharacterized protein n=1 Tax=Thanatephorus cucumeris (strain AG1-IA) TaxID=983506 RepID=L8WW82_THACA|nr:hypothetical protein AG1IA_04922 [Rhizoctonia solani AG-1 IA]